jgi:RNA polymerase sigma-70 factor (ECF subfamily)
VDPDISDGELLAASSSRPDAFAAFYDRYETAVVGYFTRRTGDPEVAADLTAEVFAAVLGAAGRYRPEAPTAAGWLFTIARNTLAKSLRRGRVEAHARRRVGIREAVAFTSEELERVEYAASASGCPRSSARQSARASSTSAPTRTSPVSSRPRSS